MSTATDFPTRPNNAVDRQRRAYESFFAEYAGDIRRVASEYTSNRVARRRMLITSQEKLNNPTWEQDATMVTRVLKGIPFIPAAEGRYTPLALGAVQYFVLHRPGDDPPSCTFTNTILTGVIPSAPKDAAVAHFVIGPAGELVQMVDLADMAHHVGGGARGVNNRTAVGAEISGAIGEPMTAAQYSRLAWLIARMARLFSFPVDAQHIVKHSQLTTTRRDPGPHCDYDRVLRDAAAALTRTPATIEFESPFSPESQANTAMLEIIDAAGRANSPGEQSVLLAQAGQLNAVERTSQLLSSDRTRAALSSQEHATKVYRWRAASAATLAATVTKLVSVRPPPPPVVVGYNFDTGQWTGPDGPEGAV